MLLLGNLAFPPNVLTPLVMPWFSFHFSDFAFSFLSILFEGVPFLLLGAIISGGVEVWLPPQTLTRLLPKNPIAAVLLSGLLGGVFPMCECGAVVVIRRFLAKGLPPACAVTYMLAAPIVSPLVAVSTFAAFRSQDPWVMTSMRLILGYSIAVGAGLIVHGLSLGAVFAPKLIETLPRREKKAQGGGAILSRGLASSGVRTKRIQLDIVTAPQTAAKPRMAVNLGRVLQAATSDFLDVALFFVIGAAVAATLNTAVDQATIQPLAGNPVASILVMMAMAGAMALCSSTDAFIAASFIAFPFAAKLAFLVFGPVFDVKLFFLYGLVFRRRFIVLLALGLFVSIALLCLRISTLGL